MGCNCRKVTVNHKYGLYIERLIDGETEIELKRTADTIWALAHYAGDYGPGTHTVIKECTSLTTVWELGDPVEPPRR